jgi:fumarate reductase flavoprotein subunit
MKGPHPDCVVVGGGLAGMCAARRLQQAGADALVLEKGEDNYGHNNARISGGLLHLAWRDMEEPPELLRAQLMEETDGEIEPDLADALALQAGRALRWLAAEGVVMRPKGDKPYLRHALYPPRTGTGRRIATEFGPDRMMRALYDNFRRGGGTVLLGSPARAITPADAGRRWRVHYRTRDADGSIGTDAIVVADGGFQANAAMMSSYVGPNAALSVLRAWPSAVGDGLRMLLALGAATNGLGRVYGHMLSRDALVNDALWPYPTMDKLCLTGLLIDRSGARFVQNAATGVELVTLLARTEDPRGYSVVFDDASWETAGRDNPYNTAVPNPDLARRGGHLVSAPDIGKLAVALGVEPAGLCDAVAGHNRRVDVPTIAQPPFHAARVAPGVTFTMGGVRVDRNASVVDLEGRPMPGLYAAGSTAGGIHGGPHGGYVGGLAVALEQGLLAAQHVSGAVLPDAGAGMGSVP